MQSRLYLIDLYDIYSDLLTEKQKEYFEEYYFDNLSLAEIAENNNVSRNAIHKQLKETEEKLKHLESVLNIKEKNHKLETIINEIEDENIKKKLEKLI